MGGDVNEGMTRNGKSATHSLCPRNASVPANLHLETTIHNLAKLVEEKQNYMVRERDSVWFPGSAVPECFTMINFLKSKTTKLTWNPMLFDCRRLDVHDSQRTASWHLFAIKSK